MELNYNYTTILTHYTDWIQSLIEYTMGTNWKENMNKNLDIIRAGEHHLGPSPLTNRYAPEKDIYLAAFHSFCSIVSLLLNIFIAGAFVSFQRANFLRFRNLIVVAIISISCILLTAVVCKAFIFFWPGGDRTGSSSVYVPILGIPGVVLFLNIILTIAVFDRI